MARRGVSGTVPGVQPPAHAAVRQMRPMIALEIGPIIPTQNSVLGSSGSFSMDATPPSANSVIDRVDRPCDRATRACDISCARSVAKKNIAVRMEIAQMTLSPHSLWLAVNWLASDITI